MPFDSLPQPIIVAEQLRAAKALIENPDDWWQGSCQEFCDVRERPRMCAGSAVSYTRSGGISWGVEGSSGRRDLLDAAANTLGYSDLVALNDESDHATVMKMFDRAIELAEARELAGIAEEP
jgi:hypothetical protein